MDENRNQTENASLGDGEIRFTSPFLKKLDNFWYHYKWHTLIALFFVVAIVICATQLSRRHYSDVYFLYAGDFEIAKNREGALSQAENMEKTLVRFAPDRDGDGEVTTSLLPLFLLTNAQIEEVNASGDYEANVVLIKQNLDVFETDLIYSDYYLCLLSPEIYDLYKLRDGISLFEPLAPLADGTSPVFYDDSAIYLSSTALAGKPGFAALPDDTLIAVRSLSEFASGGGKKTKNIKMHDAAIETFKAILVPVS